ncbi:MAG TPA: Hsp70 family protein, partial [Polyangiaceae bacterium]|nr:Hsp70 family protein [Polyangiaceae bacterium]
MSEQRFTIGIDLGTTHTAMASASLETPDAKVSVFDVPQLVAAGSVEARSLLPSFLYFAHESDAPLALPWATHDYAVGEFARARAAEAPGRVVSSAKSWLSHAGVDRRSPLLPVTAAADIEKISPVEASFRYLDHLGEAFRSAHQGQLSLGEQEVVLTVPASFDAAARDLTVEAAYAAGLENVTLLEEPQAALYAWIEAHGEAFRTHLKPLDVVLVIDIGGGTTDFSAIALLENQGSLELHRVAVGDHILLGGDNMDLLLAAVVRNKLRDAGTELDAWQMTSLSQACRAAKEQLLAENPPESVPIVIPSRGSQLLGQSIRTELLRQEVERVILDGFFPGVELAAKPTQRQRAGLAQLGLPYASDPAITKHLAHFLTRQAGALANLPGFPAASELLRPTSVLFNGGVVKSQAIRGRLLACLNQWLEASGAPPIRVLPGEDPDLAVARGAAYYGKVRRGRGLRIRGGTARAYYVGIESPMPAIPGLEPPISALCVAPFGMEEGSQTELPKHELGVIVGEPVEFRFFGSSVRRGDSAGTLLEHGKSGELEELSPIGMTLVAEGRQKGEFVPVHLRASVT